ncbi:unnamed protein product [Larinioides sclopetarius]|uniref:Uncharacterized protein n=1 Tax=Larinioides sclopetarius TaxID=280406 RepID=A0AAV2B825_9ARAC
MQLPRYRDSNISYFKALLKILLAWTRAFV